MRGKKLKIKMLKIINIEIKDRCHYAGKYGGAAYSRCNFKYSIPKEITIIIHNGSNYNYHFIIKELA